MHQKKKNETYCFAYNQRQSTFMNINFDLIEKVGKNIYIYILPTGLCKKTAHVLTHSYKIIGFIDFAYFEKKTKKKYENFPKNFFVTKSKIFFGATKIKCYLRSYMFETRVVWGPALVFEKKIECLHLFLKKYQIFTKHENMHMLMARKYTEKKISRKKNFFFSIFFLEKRYG